MQSNEPLLTIAIPTYNRERYLRELLSILLDQLINEPRVELIISDNASPDETPAIIEEYQRRGLQVRYIRNMTNIGADANFLQCFEQARGKYVWIFGDDDIIVPGGIAMILSHLELKDFDLVYVSSFPIASSAKSYVFKSRNNAMEFDDAKPFVKRIHIYFTFISGNIINKDRLRSLPPSSFSVFLGTNLVQLSWIYAALNSFRSGLYIQEKLIGARVDNTGGYKLTEVFGSRLKRVTEQSLHSPHLRKLIINGTVQRFWPGMLLNYRRTNKLFEKDTSPAKALTAVFKDNLRYWIFVYPILALPTALGTCWFFLVRILNRIDKALGFVL